MEIRVDIRSDTVTKPSPEMRKAMYEAEVGDDVYRDDPTVNRLQEKAAEMLGKEAGLFVTSGTQGNLVSVLSQAQRGDEIILGDMCHIFNNEAKQSSSGNQWRARPLSRSNPVRCGRENQHRPAIRTCLGRRFPVPRRGENDPKRRFSHP